MASFTDADKAELRYHLGYPDVDSMAAVRNDVLIVHPYQTKLEYVMDHVTTSCIPRVQKLMAILDSIETQLTEANERLQVVKADVVLTNPMEQTALRNEYRYWRSRICNMLNVEPNPMEAGGTGACGINVRVK